MSIDKPSRPPQDDDASAGGEQEAARPYQPGDIARELGAKLRQNNDELLARVEAGHREILDNWPTKLPPEKASLSALDNGPRPDAPSFEPAREGTADERAAARARLQEQLDQYAKFQETEKPGVSDEELSPSEALGRTLRRNNRETLARYDASTKKILDEWPTKLPPEPAAPPEATPKGPPIGEDDIPPDPHSAPPEVRQMDAHRDDTRDAEAEARNRVRLQDYRGRKSSLKAHQDAAKAEDEAQLARSAKWEGTKAAWSERFKKGREFFSNSDKKWTKRGEALGAAAKGVVDKLPKPHPLKWINEKRKELGQMAGKMTTDQVERFAAWREEKAAQWAERAKTPVAAKPAKGAKTKDLRKEPTAGKPMTLQEEMDAFMQEEALGGAYAIDQKEGGIKRAIGVAKEEMGHNANEKMQNDVNDFLAGNQQNPGAFTGIDPAALKQAQVAGGTAAAGPKAEIPPGLHTGFDDAALEKARDPKFEKYFADRNKDVDAKAEKLGVLGWVRKIGDTYNKFPTWAKIGIGASLGAAAIGASVFGVPVVPAIAWIGTMAQRAAGGAGMFRKFEEHLKDTHEGKKSAGRFGIGKLSGDVGSFVQKKIWYQEMASGDERERAKYAGIMAVAYIAGMTLGVGGGIYALSDWFSHMLGHDAPAGGGGGKNPAEHHDSGKGADANNPDADSKGGNHNADKSGNHAKGGDTHDDHGDTKGGDADHSKGGDTTIDDAKHAGEKGGAGAGAAENPFGKLASVEDGTGRGYEHLLKNMWREIHADKNFTLPAGTDPNSDIARLFNATSEQAANAEVHKIATDHGFFNANHSSDLIEKGSTISIDSKGGVLFSQAGTADAVSSLPDSAPTTPDLDHVRARLGIDHHDTFADHSGEVAETAKANLAQQEIARQSAEYGRLHHSGVESAPAHDGVITSAAELDKSAPHLSVQESTPADAAASHVAEQKSGGTHTAESTSAEHTTPYTNEHGAHIDPNKAGHYTYVEGSGAKSAYFGGGGETSGAFDTRYNMALKYATEHPNTRVVYDATGPHLKDLAGGPLKHMGSITIVPGDPGPHIELILKDSAGKIVAPPGTDALYPAASGGVSTAGLGGVGLLSGFFGRRRKKGPESTTDGGESNP